MQTSQGLYENRRWGQILRDCGGQVCVLAVWGGPEQWKLSPWSVASLLGFDLDRAGKTGPRTLRLAHNVC